MLALVLLASLVAAPAHAAVSVERIQLTFDEPHTFVLNNSIEYIFDFVPSNQDGPFPTRLWARSSSGDTTQPLLMTARLRSGATTWQLPYLAPGGKQVFYELERTLCDNMHDVNTPGCDSQDIVRGAFSLHVSSACQVNVLFELRATPLREWQLPFQNEYRFTVDQTSPRAHLYKFAEGQDSVRVVVASDDDICAVISVQNNSCPVSETLPEVARQGLRMSMMRSGATQLWRSNFPRGFFVVALIDATDEACTGVAETESDSDSDWLWGAIITSDEPEVRSTAKLQSRRKNLTVTVVPSLSRSQYAVASGVTLAVFLVFYLSFMVLVFAQRYAPFASIVAPKAVLADKQNGVETDNGGVAVTDTISPPATHRRRRDSNATFDSCDGSDSDEEPPAAANANGAPTTPSQRIDTDQANPEPDITRADQPQNAVSTPTPFGLPTRLTVAALSRHNERTLKARSNRYLQTLYIVAVFYALPVLQFVFTFQIILNVSGSLDLCYYNFLCAHPAGMVSDFNHVFSNLGYLMLGVLFIVQVRRRQARRKRKPRHEEYGIPAHYGLFESLGAGMMVVALLSASYHVCPNRLNFQFDTAFMFVLSVLSMVKIYQSRHPDINARAHATFGVLAVLIAFVVWGVLGGGAFFWALITVVHIFTFLLLSLHIYYVGQFTLDKQGISETTRGLRELPSGGRPLYTARLVLIAIANAVNWTFAIYGMITMKTDFAGHMLYVLLCNTLMYMVFYLVMKLLHGERLRWYAWVYLASAAAAWAPALYFFGYGSSSWSSTPAQSRQLNHECMVLQFYDAHDLWHFLSAVALYLSFNAMLTWDDGLSAVKRTDIAVF